MLRRRECPKPVSLTQRCRLLSIWLSSLYDKPKVESAETVALMRRIDELFLKHLDELRRAADLTACLVLSY